MYLSRGDLADEASSCRLRISIVPETKTFDVGMCCCTVFARVALHFTNLYHCDSMKAGQGLWKGFIGFRRCLEESFAMAGTEMGLCAFSSSFHSARC